MGQVAGPPVAATLAEAEIQNQQNQQQVPPQNQVTVNNQPQVRIDGEFASVSSEDAATTHHMNQYGFLLNKPAGEGTSNARPHPTLFSNNIVLDLAVLETAVTPEYAEPELENWKQRVELWNSKEGKLQQRKSRC